MNFSSLVRKIYFNRIFKTCCFEKWIQFLTHLASYSSVFFAHAFRPAIPSWFATAVWSDFLFVQFPSFRRRNVAGRSRCRSFYVQRSRVLRTSITSGYADEFELDYTRQPSLQTFRPGCLVNYALSLSNADPRIKRWRAERWNERRIG